MNLTYLNEKKIVPQITDWNMKGVKWLTNNFH